MTATAKLPVFLLTGFLGSGKTTLLNAALGTPELARTAVVVNELGEVGVDHLIVAQASDSVLLLEGGCLCCMSTGALHDTLADLAYRRQRGEIPPFERVIVETSGAADPAPLLNILLGNPLVVDRYALAATVCAVDAQHFIASRAQYPELDKQVALADRIVVTKRDLADPAQAMSIVAALNPDAEQVESVVEMFSPPTHAQQGMPHRPGRGYARPPMHGSGIRAFSFAPASPVTWAGWAAWAGLVSRTFGARLIRVKGLLRMEDSGEIALVQGVQGVFHPPQRSQYLAPMH